MRSVASVRVQPAGALGRAKPTIARMLLAGLFASTLSTLSLPALFAGEDSSIQASPVVVSVIGPGWDQPPVFLKAM